MDIEGAEWQVLKHLEDSGVLDLVDELLVEMHYHHPVMAGFGWNQFPKTSYLKSPAITILAPISLVSTISDRSSKHVAKSSGDPCAGI